MLSDPFRTEENSHPKQIRGVGLLFRVLVEALRGWSGSRGAGCRGFVRLSIGSGARMNFGWERSATPTASATGVDFDGTL